MQLFKAQNRSKDIVKIVHVSWYSCQHAAETDTKEKKMLNKVTIFVFFVHKKYSPSVIKLTMNHWCHMDYFIDILTTILGLKRFSWITVYTGSESSRVSSKLSSFVLRRWTKALQVWNNMRASNIFGCTKHLKFYISMFNKAEISRNSENSNIVKYYCNLK